MGRLTTEREGLFYTDGGEKQKILDFKGFLSNCSAIQLYSLDKNVKDLPHLMASVLQDNGVLRQNLPFTWSDESIQLFMGLLFSRCLLAHRPLQVVELGSSSPALCFFLCRYLPLFHRESQIHAVSNILYDNHWANILSILQERVANLSMLTMDCASPALSEDFFDVVIVNSREAFPDSFGVVANAARIVKNGGLVLLYHERNEQISLATRLFFAGSTIYETEDGAMLEVCQVDSSHRNFIQKTGNAAAIAKSRTALSLHIRAVRAALAGGYGETLAELSPVLVEIEQALHIILANCLIPEFLEVKQPLIDLREALLNQALAGGSSLKAGFRRDLEKKLLLLPDGP